MTKKITATVGRKPSINRYADVVTVQKLLNGVDYEQGGPYVKLKVDGHCGPKTEKAIQVFQLKHFGWSGADGMVQPGHQTMAKLNEINSQPAVSSAFVLHQIKSYGKLKRSNPQDWFFRIDLITYDSTDYPSALFWFGPKGRVPKYRPTKKQFDGKKSKYFETSAPCTLKDLAGPAVCSILADRDPSTTKNYEGTILEKLEGAWKQFMVKLPVGMDEEEPAGPNVRVRKMKYSTATVTEYHGELLFLE